MYIYIYIYLYHIYIYIKMYMYIFGAIEGNMYVFFVFSYVFMFDICL